MSNAAVGMSLTTGGGRSRVASLRRGPYGRHDNHFRGAESVTPPKVANGKCPRRRRSGTGRPALATSLVPSLVLRR